MVPQLNDDLQKAVDQHVGNEPVKAEHPGTHRVYYIYDERLHERARRALQQQEDLDAVQQGIDAMEAGQVVPFEEVDARIRQQLGLPDRT